MRPGLVIFDCDGTLVDSEILVGQVLAEMAIEQGLDLSLEEAISAFKGVKMAESVLELERRLGRALPEEFVPNLRQRSSDIFETSLREISGARELVSNVSTAKCVASAGPRAKIELTLTVTGLLPFFGEHIFSSYEVGIWKPDPGFFLHVAEKMGFLPEECIVVEDSRPGILGGVAAGMRVFAYQPEPPDFEIPEGVTVIRELSELRPLLCDS